MNAIPTKKAAAVLRKPGEGEFIAHNAEKMWFTLTAEDTGGRVGLMERVVSPKFQSPPRPHTHQTEDWFGYVISGRLVFSLDGVETEVPEGATLFVPRGVYFRWWNPDDTPVRALFAYMPGGFEAYFKKLIQATAPKAEKLHDYDKTLPDLMRVQDEFGMVRKDEG